MKNCFLKNINLELRNDNCLKYKTFYCKSERKTNKKNNSDNKDKNKFHIFINKKSIDTPYKYDNLYDKFNSYSNRNILIKEIKNYRDNKRRANSNKLNKFHHLYIHNKIKASSNTLNFNSLTTKNETFIDTNSNSISNKTPNGPPITSNFLKYNNNIKKSRNKNYFNRHNNYNLKTESDISSLYTNITNNRFLNNKTINYKNIKNLKAGSNLLNKNRIINQINKYDLNKKKFSLSLSPPKKILNYKFIDTLGNLDTDCYFEGKLISSRGTRKGLTEQILSKFYYNVINKIKKDFYQTQCEIQQNPVIILEKYEKFQNLNKKYYKVYTELVKKYFMYLYSQIGEEKYKLELIKEERDKLKDENFQIIKKINMTNEKLLFYQSFMGLLMKIKYNTPSLVTIPEEHLRRYGVKVIRSIYNYHKSGILKPPKRNYNKRTSYILITDLKENYKQKFSRKKTTMNIKLNKKKSSNNTNTTDSDLKELKVNKNFKHQQSSFKKIEDIPQNPFGLSMKKKSDDLVIAIKDPIFNDEEDLNDRLRDIQNHLIDLFKEYTDKKYFIQTLKMEMEREKYKVKIDKNIQYNKKEIEILKEELMKIKQQNELYINFKNYLNSSKNNNNYIEYTQKITEKKEALPKAEKDEEKKKKKKENFGEKLIKILLNYNFNIEKFIECKGIYRFLESPQEIRINDHGKEYMKILFCIKILEMIFLKLMQQKRVFLSNVNIRDKYLQYQATIEKDKNLIKIKEKKKERIIQELKKEREILIKANKVAIIPRKRNDPFSTKLFYEKHKKNEKDKLQKLIKKEENDFQNYFNY